MSMKKILTILGARPQFIKASVVSNAIERNDEIEEVIVHTGQHYDANMSDIFFNELGMCKPDYSLGVNGGMHGEMTGRMLQKVEEVILTEKPHVVMVYGDTNSTLAGALAAVKLHVPVAHIESGLRSFNMKMPEEVNRILTDRVSNFLFTPTQTATKNLIDEGVDLKKISMVGDVMYDVALHHGARVTEDSGLLRQLAIRQGEYILTTIHRAENTDNELRLITIVDALMKISDNLKVVWPLHPRTRAVLSKLGKLQELDNKIYLIDPVGYLDMVQLEKFSALIVTDSGGVQKEAFFHRVPCVTLRDETEWDELVVAGWNKLVPPLDPSLIVEAIKSSLGKMGADIEPYGDGSAAEKIVRILGNNI